MEPITLNWYLSQESSPIAFRYMLSASPQHRKRRMTALLANACEVALRLQEFGGSIKLNAALNPAEFAEPIEDKHKWTGFPISVQVYPYVSPFLYRAIKGRSDEQVRNIISTALESYILMIGATTLPTDELKGTTIQMGSGVSKADLSSSEEKSEEQLATQHAPDESLDAGEALQARVTTEPDVKPYTEVENEKDKPWQSREEKDDTDEGDIDDVMAAINRTGKAT